MSLFHVYPVLRSLGTTKSNPNQITNMEFGRLSTELDLEPMYPCDTFR